MTTPPDDDEPEGPDVDDTADEADEQFELEDTDDLSPDAETSEGFADGH